MKSYTPLFTPEKFATLDIYEKRVAIAKDVINRLKKGFLIPEPGNFIAVNDNPLDLDKDDINNNKCEVCAKGAIVCSWIGALNKRTTNDFGLNSGIDGFGVPNGTKELVSVFGPELYDVLEGVFELWEMRDCSVNKFLTTSEGKAYNAFIQKRRKARVGPKAHLMYLMRNLIRNKGKLLIPGINKKKGFLVG